MPSYYCDEGCEYAGPEAYNSPCANRRCPVKLARVACVFFGNMIVAGGLEYARRHGVECGLSNEWGNPYWLPNTVGVAAQDVKMAGYTLEVFDMSENYEPANERMLRMVREEQ